MGSLLLSWDLLLGLYDVGWNADLLIYVGLTVIIDKTSICCEVLVLTGIRININE